MPKWDMGYLAFAAVFAVFFLLLAVFGSTFVIPTEALLPIGGIIVLLLMIAIAFYGMYKA